MKRAIQMICLFSTLTLSGLSSSAFGHPQSDQGDLPDDSLSISEPKHPVPPPVPGTQYTMKFIKPSSKYECEIRYVTPNPNINYTIRNLRPELNTPLMRERGFQGGINRGHSRRHQ